MSDQGTDGNTQQSSSNQPSRSSQVKDNISRSLQGAAESPGTLKDGPVHIDNSIVKENLNKFLKSHEPDNKPRGIFPGNQPSHTAPKKKLSPAEVTAVVFITLVCGILCFTLSGLLSIHFLDDISGKIFSLVFGFWCFIVVVGQWDEMPVSARMVSSCSAIFSIFFMIYASWEIIRDMRVTT